MERGGQLAERGGEAVPRDLTRVGCGDEAVEPVRVLVGPAGWLAGVGPEGRGDGCSGGTAGLEGVCLRSCGGGGRRGTASGAATWGIGGAGEWCREGIGAAGRLGGGGSRVGSWIGGTGYRISGRWPGGRAGAWPRALAGVAVYRTLVHARLPRPSSGVVGALPCLHRQPGGPAVQPAVARAGGGGSSRISS